MQEAAIDIVVRDGRPDEEALVYKSWVGTYSSSLFARGISRGLFEERHTKLVRDILKRGGVIRVAHAAEEPDAILGWAVIERPNVLHYVYVKEPFRRLGIARRLVAEVPARFRFTHYHQNADQFVNKFRGDKGGMYDPYLAWSTR